MNTTDQTITSTLIGRRVDAVTGSDNEATPSPSMAASS